MISLRRTFVALVLATVLMALPDCPASPICIDRNPAVIDGVRYDGGIVITTTKEAGNIKPPGGVRPD